ncbi:MAG: hypothetical protein JSW41_01675 [Candidatus Aenigmatarchaeota archaeon]|nr:MAG: hypothetical protein JSW41_01675 [Candidatus Aenigmarchaeota archaeon]
MVGFIDKLTSDYGVIILAILIMVFLLVLVFMFAKEQGLIDIDFPRLW